MGVAATFVLPEDFEYDIDVVAEFLFRVRQATENRIGGLIGLLAGAATLLALRQDVAAVSLLSPILLIATVAVIADRWVLAPRRAAAIAGDRFGIPRSMSLRLLKARRLVDRELQKDAGFQKWKRQADKKTCKDERNLAARQQLRWVAQRVVTELKAS